MFLETPEHLRRGRKRYIVASFAITCLSTLIASLDIADYFQLLFQSTSPSHWRELRIENSQNWKRLLSDTLLGILVRIGDTLLVSVYHHDIETYHALMFHRCIAAT